MSEVESPIPAEDPVVAGSSQPPSSAATTDPGPGVPPSDAEPAAEAPSESAAAEGSEPIVEVSESAPAAAAAVVEADVPDEPVASGAEAVVEGTPADERPLVGPRIIGMAPPDRPPAPVKRLPRPRRRRSTAADKHRRLFFQKLNEMRREGRPGADDAADTDTDTDTDGAATPGTGTAGEAELEVAAPTDAEPSANEPPADEATAQAPIAADDSSSPEPTPVAERGPARQPRREAPPLDAKARARLAVAVERVGGAEVIQAALVPKQDEEGAPKRWALVCCELAQGIPPGDPVYLAWLRLASTPVREVKGALRALAPEREARGRGSGPRGERSGGGGGARGERSGGGAPRDRGDQPRGGGRGGPRERAPRPPRGERIPAGAGLDGSFTPKVRIVTSDNDERAERDRLRKEEREAKRRAAQERLDRLGF